MVLSRLLCIVPDLLAVLGYKPLERGLAPILVVEEPYPKYLITLNEGSDSDSPSSLLWIFCCPKQDESNDGGVCACPDRIYNKV